MKIKVGAFGIGNNGTVFLIIGNIIIIGVIAKFIFSKKNEVSDIILAGLALIISGGIGNLIDRIFRGFVIDYIDVNPIIKYPMFNIADICIVIGCIMIIIKIVTDIIKGRNK